MYRIHIAPTGYGRQHRIIVMRDSEKWDDVLVPSIRCADRTLRRMRAEYRVPRVRHWTSPDRMNIWAA